MPFELTADHFESFHHHGYAIFRELLPLSLLRDLRRAADAGRDIARKVAGNPNVQRLQPVSKYAELDQQPFEDFNQLPELAAALEKLLTPDHFQLGNDVLGIFYEPGEKPHCTAWHRDATADTPNVPDRDEFLIMLKDSMSFIQVNCALYTDTCTWYVPGSGPRPDSEAERDLNMLDYLPRGNDYDSETLERQQLAYCRAMPNAIQAVLEPGDYMIYNPVGWHIGNYSPDRRRTTLHTVVSNPSHLEWIQKFWGRPIEGRKPAAV